MIKIVIVDDHALVREAWNMLLGKNSSFHIIHLCENGEQAVETCRVLKPEVILMDINMEPVNGFQATKLIREFDQEVKIIGISVHTGLPYVKGIIAAGANGYVTKNSSLEEMTEAIFEVLRGHEYICKEILEAKTREL